jgi:predicted phosphodiesterase
MKIAITADLHYGITSQWELSNLAEDIIRSKPDFIVMAGDIAESIQGPRKFEQCLKLFNKYEGLIGIILGNHDLYAQKYHKHDSADLWTHIIKDKADRLGLVWLEDQNFIYEGVAVVGSYLHYDYSAKDLVGPCAGYGNDFYAKNKKNINADGKYHNGLPNDLEFSASIGEKFRERLLSAQKNLAVRDIVVVTHVPCAEPIITRKPQDYNWSVGTPYFGNLSHQELFLSCNKLKEIVSGHSHVAQEGMLGNIRCRVVPSDYGNPKFLTVNT